MSVVELQNAIKDPKMFFSKLSLQKIPRKTESIVLYDGKVAKFALRNVSSPFGVNYNRFKTWTNNLEYVLGLDICADDSEVFDGIDDALCGLYNEDRIANAPVIEPSKSLYKTKYGNNTLSVDLPRNAKGQFSWILFDNERSRINVDNSNVTTVTRMCLTR